MEEEIRKSKKIKNNSCVLITVLVIGLLIITALGGYFVGKTQVTRESSKQKETEEKSTPLELTSTIKKRLEEFVITGSYFDYAGNETWNYFSKGTKEISKGVKLQMAFNATKKDTNDIIIPDDEKEKLTGVKPDANEPVKKMNKADFDSTYKELFNEEPKYEFEEMRGCPAPMAMNKETGVIYLFSRCGGTGANKITTEVESYDSDETYYYVYTKTTNEDLSVAENPTTTTKLVWKFDKNLEFVSTEKK